MMLNGSRLFSAMIIVFIGWQWSQAGWIMTKAQLAQWLIADAWQQALETKTDSESAHKPWRWADTWPIARLQAPAHKVDLYVLEGDRGNALAFGPGRNQSSRLPGEGTSVIGGHRDTHFRFLKDIKLGEPLRVQTRSGKWLDYNIQERTIIDVNQDPLRVNLNDQQLVLVTCYPFDTLTSGGPLRLVVYASLNKPEITDLSLHEDQLFSQYTESSPAMAF